MYRDGSVESYVPYERLAVPRGALLAATAGECGVCLCEGEGVYVCVCVCVCLCECVCVCECVCAVNFSS